VGLTVGWFTMARRWAAARCGAREESVALGRFREEEGRPPLPWAGWAAWATQAD
jgi:hypothetical protein